MNLEELLHKIADIEYNLFKLIKHYADIYIVTFIKYDTCVKVDRHIVKERKFIEFIGKNHNIHIGIIIDGHGRIFTGNYEYKIKTYNDIKKILKEGNCLYNIFEDIIKIYHLQLRRINHLKIKYNIGKENKEIILFEPI